MSNFFESWWSFALGLVIVFITTILFIFVLGNKKIEIADNKAQAATELPGNVSKFEDDGNICYVLEENWLKFGGISCVKAN